MEREWERHAWSLVGRTRKRRDRRKYVCECGVPAAGVLNGVLGESLFELRDLGHALFDYSGNVFVCTVKRSGEDGLGEGKAKRGEEVNVLLRAAPSSSSR